MLLRHFGVGDCEESLLSGRGSSWTNTRFVTSENGALTWVVLYPNGDNRAEIIILGERTTVEGIGFDDLLSIIGNTDLLCQSA